LDTGALNEVFNASNIKNEIKEEDTSFDYSFQPVGSDFSHVKMEKDTSISDITSEKIDPETNKAWQKLMNLLMQLRKVCNQYPPPPLS